MSKDKEVSVERQILEIFTRMDKNKDGRISSQEFTDGESIVLAYRIASQWRAPLSSGDLFIFSSVEF